MCGSVNGINVADPLDFSGTRRRADAAAAEKRAAATEAERQGRITTNVNNINSAFAGREPQYQQLGDALRKRLNDQLTLQRTQATRQAKFGLARAGLTGGSAAVDTARTLQREGEEGVLNAERTAQKGVANLRSQDEQQRTQLVSLAQSGNDIGDASAMASSALRANLEGAQSDNLVNSLGEVFANTAATNKAMLDAAARRRGLKDAQIYAPAFSRGE